MKKIPFKFNSTGVIFFILGVLTGLMAWFSAQRLWFGSDAGWDKMSFGMLFVYLTFTLIFWGLTVWTGWYSARPYRSGPDPSTRKVITVGLLIVFGLAVWLIGIVYLSKYIDKQIYLTRTAETPAEIVSESSYTSGSRKSVSTIYTYRYSYTIDGRVYQGVSDSFKSLKKGGAVKACYDPANPNSSQIREADFQCGNEGKYE